MATFLNSEAQHSKIISCSNKSMDRNSAKWSFNAFQSMADSLTHKKVIKKKIRFGSRDLHINFQLSIFETIDESRFTNIVTN